MNKSVNEIAKDLGLVELSFNEILVLSDSEKGICIEPELLREHLEYVGKRCCFVSWRWLLLIRRYANRFGLQ